MELIFFKGAEVKKINPEFCQNVKEAYICIWKSPSRCMPRPLEWKRGAGGSGQDFRIRDKNPCALLWWARLGSAFGHEKLLLLLTGNCLVSLNAYPCHKWGPFSGSDSIVSTLITNRISEYGAKCFLPSNFQIAGLRPKGDTSSLLVTCRCILKKDSHKNYIKIHKHKA